MTCPSADHEPLTNALHPFITETMGDVRRVPILRASSDVKHEWVVTALPVDGGDLCDDVVSQVLAVGAQCHERR